MKSARCFVVGVSVLIGLVAARRAGAHCDTMDGPVVADARIALEKGDVTPVLKWVQDTRAEEITTAFKKTLTVRAKGPEARELADMYFFETLVRVHRAGEGAPYTGLKPAGTDPGPAVSEADRAIKNGSADGVVKLLTDQMAEGVRKRFAHVAEARKHAAESVEAGRQFVAAYIEFTHYVEGLYVSATGAAHAAEETHAAGAAHGAEAEGAHH